MSVRVDGEVPVPRREWYHVIDYLTRIDELLELIVGQLDQTNRLLRALVGVAAPPTPVPVPAPMPPEAVARAVFLPFRVNLVATDSFTVGEEYRELLLSYDLVLLTADADVLIARTPEAKGFPLVAEVYLAVYRSEDFRKLYVRSATGTANVYVSYYEVTER